MADSDVSGMLVRIEATTAQLRQELARGETAVANASGRIDNSLGAVDQAFDRTGLNATSLQRSISSAFSGMGLAATAGVAGLVAITTKTAEYAQEVKNLSTLSNTSTADFQRMAAGARTVGVDQSKLADIFKDTTDRAGEFISRGGGEMADFFKEIAPRVGVTAQQFANLSGPQALQLYYTSLEKAGLNQQQMTTYMEAMADEATALIPLLRNNGKGFKDLGDQAEAAGNILSNIEVARLVELNQSIMSLEATFAGATRQLVLGMLPGIESVTQRLGEWSKNGASEALGAGIGFLAENLNVLAGVMGTKVAASFIGYLSNLAESTTASVQARSANIAQAASTVELATANQIAAQSAVVRAEREAIAARGTAVQTQMSIQLAEARMAERTATAQLAVAQAGLKAASTGVLALLGGPAGIAALAIGAGIAFLTMGSNAKDAAQNLDELKEPLDQLILKFRQMTAEQRAGALVRWSEQQAAAVKKAGEQYSELETMMQRALVGPRSSEAGTTAFRTLTQEMAEARKTGASIVPILEKAGASGVSQNTIDSWKKQAEQFSNADLTAKTAEKSIAALQAEASRPVKAAGGDDTAATNAANTYLATLEKQAHTLQDKTALEQADRFIVENKIKGESALAAKIRERAKAIDALKAADKAATKGDSEAERAKKAAATALEQQVKAAQTAFETLKKSYDPVGAAADDFKTKTAELSLLLGKGKITQAEYAQGTAWLADEFNGAVQAATGLSRALQYQADLEKQLNNSRASYDAMASAVGMGDQESERAQARLDLERETNDKVLSLRTELATATTEKQRQDLDKQIALTQEYGAKQVTVMTQGWASIDAAQADWSNGAVGAWKNYQENAKDVASQTRAAFTSLYDGMTDAAVDWAFGADQSFTEVGISFAKMLAKMAMQAAASSVFSSVFGSVLSGAVGGVSAGAGVAPAATGAGMDYSLAGASSGLTYNAKGGVYDSPSLSSFSGEVYNSPQTFAFAKGAGIFAEAGPEAIMPLTRGSDGSLGVRALGGGGATATGTGDIYVDISIASDGQADVSSNQSGLEAFGKEVGSFVEQKYKQLEAKSLAPQGNIRKAINGRG
jgi:lambda family phage tail tape measure protein